MYGKVFDQLFDGSLYGHLEAAAVFMAMIAIAEPDGVVDLTLTALTRKTGWPQAFVETGIRELEAPDPDSRTPDEEGRRIVRLRENTNWGWRIVNYLKYRGIRDEDSRRQYMRQYMRTYRGKKFTSNSKSTLAPLAHAEEEEDKNPPTPQRGAPTDSAIRPEGLDSAAWERWVTYRREIRKPLKPASMPAAQRKLAAFGSDQAQVVEQSIANGWQGMFPLKDGTGQRKARPRIVT